MTRALHFGFIADDLFKPINIAGHDDQTTEHPFILDLGLQGGKVRLRLWLMGKLGPH